MKVKRSSFEFNLTPQVSSKYPKWLPAKLKATTKATLIALPARLLKEKLSLAGPYEVVLTVLDAKAVHRLNREYRKKDKPTDVLSFSQLEGPQFPTPFPQVGEVILCWEVCKEQAKAYGTGIQNEVARLTVHGVLHLFGYDHEISAAEARKMFRLQNKILRSLTNGRNRI